MLNESKLEWKQLFPYSAISSLMKDDEPISEAIKSYVVKNMASHMDLW